MSTNGPAPVSEWNPSADAPTDLALDLEVDLNKDWDAIVIGAGPAGAISAFLLAGQGHHVLLVDKATFPRHKVCGSCLSAKTLSYLAQAGLHDLPGQLGAAPITGINLCTAAGAVTLALAGGLALSRAALDGAIVRRAQAAGAVFLPSTSAVVGDCNTDKRLVQIQTHKTRVTLTASCVLVADGINGRALSQLEVSQGALFKPVLAPASRIGAGTVVTLADKEGDCYKTGTIYMALHRAGYVGLVRLEDGRLDIAAAFDADFTRRLGSLQAATAEVLNAVGLPYLAAFDGSQWLGTAPLTRHRQSVATERLFVVGDAAAYSEPFTGEGIGWAARSALLVVPTACRAIKQWEDNLAIRWQANFTKQIATRQSLSRRLGLLLRHEAMCRLLIGGVLKHVPLLARPLVNGISMEDTKLSL